MTSRRLLSTLTRAQRRLYGDIMAGRIALEPAKGHPWSVAMLVKGKPAARYGVNRRTVAALVRAGVLSQDGKLMGRVS